MSDDWEQDPDSWKKESEGSQHEKKEEKRPVKREIIGYTLAVRPLVAVNIVPTAADIIVKNRDELKKLSSIADGQRISTDEGEVFVYKQRDNMWYAATQEDDAK